MMGEGLASGAELLVATLEVVPVWVRGPLPRHGQTSTGHGLQPVLEHRAIDLFENVPTNVNNQVRPHTEDVSVVGGVVDLAERDPIRDDRQSLLVGISDDVRRIE